MRYGQIYDTEIGRICILQEEDAIVALGFEQPGENVIWQETPLLQETISQVKEYLKGERRTFDVKLSSRGTAFQQKVWQALREISYGETRTYGQIAAAVGSPKGARAVGMACNRNPIMIIVPCHRVIGSNGSLTGFGGGLPVKEKLLKLEGRE